MREPGTLVAINSAYVHVTQDCNLACEYCFEAGAHTTDYMKKETAEQVVSFLKYGADKRKTKYIKIDCFGGEPTLNIEVIESLFDGALGLTDDGYNVSFSVCTNATIFTDRWGAFLQRWNQSSIPIRIQLSSDGCEAAQKKRKRPGGKSSFALVDTVIDKYVTFARENGLELGRHIWVHSVIAPDCTGYVYESYRYFRQKGFPGFSFNITPDLLLVEPQKTILREQFRRICNKAIEDCIAENSGIYVKHLGFMGASERNLEERFGQCGAGTGFCSILPNGDLTVCSRAVGSEDFKTFGNIFEPENVSDIYAFYFELKKETLEKCASCDVRNCNICPTANYFNTGKFDEPCEEYCLFRKEMVKMQEDMLKTMAQKNALPNDVGVSRLNVLLDNIMDSQKAIIQLLGDSIRAQELLVSTLEEKKGV